MPENVLIKKKGALIAGLLVAAMLSGMVPLQQAFATHYYSGNRWSGNGQPSCYDAFSLNDIIINGDDNRYTSHVKGQLDASRNDWNDEPSVFNLGLTSGFLCHNWISAANLGSTGATGTTWTTLSGSTITDSDTEFNVAYTWSTLNQCNPEPYTLGLTARHEYGHWVKFLHSTQAYNSIMRPAYSCTPTTVTAHDSTSLTSIYG